MVEVAGTDADPIIHQHHLQVQKPRLVLEYLHPRFKQTGVIALPGKAHRRMISVMPSQQQAHFDTPFGRLA